MDDQKLTSVKVCGHSMEPLLADGDFTYVRKVQKYSIGDIIVFKNMGINIIHRILFVNEMEHEVICKGDNAFELDKINTADVIGKVLFYERKGIKKYVPIANKKFIELSLQVSQLYIKLGKSINIILKNEIYQDFVAERYSMICKG